MNPNHLLTDRTRQPPRGVELMRYFHLEPDPWQVEALRGNHPRLLLNCSRQAGKSTVVAVLALEKALTEPGSLTLLLSRSHRQSAELFRTVSEFYVRHGKQHCLRLTKYELVLTHLSRIVSLPCQPDTVRGYAGVDLLIIDEAARVPDDLYRAVRPMLAVSGGRLICLSTPYGKRGFFHDAWARGGTDWHRIQVPAEQVARIPKEFLEEEKRSLGESWFRQEYGCSFEALEGLVFPDFARCVVPALPPEVASRVDPHPASRAASAPGDHYRRVGGIDFGFRNPFAAVWGLLDPDGVLWLTGEHYERGKPLSFHATRLPPGVNWYADPSGANEISELRVANFHIWKGDNTLRTGVAAVAARLETGRLTVLQGACPNLLAEAELYRYSPDPADRKAEAPVDEHNHALAALRYLVSKIDAGRLARTPPSSEPSSQQPAAPPRQDPIQELWNDAQAWLRTFK